jgi:hypothetical protein
MLLGIRHSSAGQQVLIKDIKHKPYSKANKKVAVETGSLKS